MKTIKTWHNKKCLELKPITFGCEEENYLIADVILEYWTMEVVIKIVFITVFIAAKGGDHSPCPAFGRSYYILNVLARKGPISVGFVTSKTTIVFFPPSLPSFFPFLFLFYFIFY